MTENPDVSIVNANAAQVANSLSLSIVLTIFLFR